MNKIVFYYINLDKSVDRKNDMEIKLKNYTHERFRAIDTNNPIYIEYKNNNWIPKYHKQHPNFICCLLSHLYAVKMAYDNNLEDVIIIEDDANISIFNEVCDTFLKIWNNNKHYIDVLQLFCSSHNFYKDITDIRFNKWMKNGVCFGKCQFGCQYYATTGIIYSRKGIETIMKLYKNGHFDLSNSVSDVYLVADAFIYEKTNSYSLKFPIIYEDKYKSTLGHNYDYEYIDTFLENNRKHILRFFNNYRRSIS